MHVPIPYTYVHVYMYVLPKFNCCRDTATYMYSLVHGKGRGPVAIKVIKCVSKRQLIHIDSQHSLQGAVSFLNFCRDNYMYKLNWANPFLRLSAS